MQAAGYSCPLDTAEVAVEADEDSESMRTLVGEMQRGKLYVFGEIVELCRKNECFVGLTGEEMEGAARSKLGKLLGRYDRRRVKDRLFVVEGKNHKRRYRAE